MGFFNGNHSTSQRSLYYHLFSYRVFWIFSFFFLHSYNHTIATNLHLGFHLTFSYKHFPIFCLCFMINILKSKWQSESIVPGLPPPPFSWAFSATWIEPLPLLQSFASERYKSKEWAVYPPSVARQDPDNPCSAYKMLYFGICARWRPIHESDAAKWSLHGHLSTLSDPSPENPVSLLLMEQINEETDESDPESISRSLPVSFHLLWFVWPLKGCSELRS